ncbi:hypothetical protein ACWGHM_17320 [Streptomyces sp. NPDC054904]|uniref:hypothetical protein n=1 Tax=unclassified Streptomyces TaxID=2593676 RepID=UPI002481BCFC|nr:hypothetical protein [Streptomyces sp. Isolate_45]MDA5285777.1 hypothetical protein [Streptomyces sp. Isolate_45]
MPGFLLRTCLLLAVEAGAALLLSEAGAPWIPVLLAVFVIGSAVPHGTQGEFTARFLVALVAVGAARLAATVWEQYGGPAEPPAARAGLAALLLLQTVTLLRLSRGASRR